MSTLAASCLIVWVEGSADHTADLIRRFDKAPKPMAYQPEFLARAWSEYLSAQHCTEAEVDPDAFIRWTYAKALAHRQPRYAAMARRWGITVQAADLATIRDADDFNAVIAAALEQPR